MRKILASVDLGSDTLKLVVGELFKGRINILAKSCLKANGIESGFITDKEQFIKCLQELFKQAEDMLGIPVKKVIVNIPSKNIKFYMNEGYTTLEQNVDSIRHIDILRAMQASIYNQLDEKEELATIMPISYKIDDEIVLNPLGKTANKLTVKTIFTSVPKENILPIIKCFEKIGVHVIDTTLGIIGDYYEFKTPKIDELIGAIINIGHKSTNVAIFNKGILTNTVCLDVGSDNIDNDLAYMFKVPKKSATSIRKNLCLAHKRGSSANIKKEYTNKEGKNVAISEYEATVIASSRIEEILKLEKNEINHLTKKEIHYIIVTGGISEMTNFSILLEEIFSQSAKIGNTKELGLRSNIYSTTIGLIKYYLDKLKLRGQEFTIFNEMELDELSGAGKRFNINENSILGKLFGYFFDN